VAVRPGEEKIVINSGMKLIFVFLDGVGLGEKTLSNPFFQSPMKRLKKEFGIEFFLENATLSHPEIFFKPIDPSGKVEGLGQSGTGQFSIYTGLNGPELLGRHHGPFLPSGLKTTLFEHNIFKKLKALNRSACYANAFPDRFIETCKALRENGKIRSSVLFEAAILENVHLRHAVDLKQKQAVSGDIINHWWGVNEKDGDREIYEIPPEEAAQNLLALAEKYDAVFYEYFHTDLCGHGRIQATSEMILDRLDGFLTELFLHKNEDTLVILTSDHGNFEESAHLRHTSNPVPLLVVGKHNHAFKHAEHIHDIVPAYLKILKEKIEENIEGCESIKVA